MKPSKTAIRFGIRVLLLPFFAGMAITATCAHLFVWLLDAKYCHKSAQVAFTDWANFWELH